MTACLQLIEGVRPWWWMLWPWGYVLRLERCLLEIFRELEDERDSVVHVHFPR